MVLTDWITNTWATVGFYKKCAKWCQLFRPILSALWTLKYGFSKLLVPILEPLNTNKYAVKDLFIIGIKIVDQVSSDLMGSIDIDSLFTNILLGEIIEICTNELLKNSSIVDGLKKCKFDDLLSLATKELYCLFNITLYKLIWKVSVGLH